MLVLVSEIELVLVVLLGTIFTWIELAFAIVGIEYRLFSRTKAVQYLNFAPLIQTAQSSDYQNSNKSQ